MKAALTRCTLTRSLCTRALLFLLATAFFSTAGSLAAQCAPFSTVYVDDNWATTPIGDDPDGGGPATNFGCDSFATIQGGINGVTAPGTVFVAAGTYDEDVVINKAGVSLLGAGAGSTNVRGPIGGPGTTMQVTASNVTIAGFTITRLGNNTGDWTNPGLNSAGIAVQGQAITGMLVRDNILTGNRTGIDVNNTNGHTIRNNVIDFNRTGLIFRNQTDNFQVEENFLTNNWTVGVLFLDASGGSNVPLQQALNSHFKNNNLSANWYGQAVDRQSGGSIPAPGANLKYFTNNWWGTTSPVVTTANSAEPGYDGQIPVAYGGTAVPPGGQPDIAGPASANIVYLPLLCSGTDTNVETTPGRGTFGFQGGPPCPLVPAPAPTATDNDYTRINNAVQASSSGQTINLLGTFDWTEPNAAASWAKGSNGIAGDFDDYSILVPANLNNVTITADNLGDATIQGPGDLAAVNLEGVFVFDSVGATTNQGWTISKIRFVDFDLAIGMFAGASNAFLNTSIIGNYIKIAQDLNATVAPADVNQNIGIHFSFGKNQTISGNTIDFDGDGVSAGANFSTQVGMQSNTSGGDVYDGLQITNNTLRVMNAQSANPQNLLGIWENAHGHTSNISVSGNSFTNLALGNNPATNLQKAFRVTSHSSATTVVNYENNTMMGANIGFQWLAGSNFSATLPVSLKSNTILGGGIGVVVQSQGSANLSFNRIVGNSLAGLNNVDGTVTAENNWWGCNAGPGAGGCDSVIGAADFTPWIVLNVSASPNTIPQGTTSTVTADMTDNSAAMDTAGLGTVPPMPVDFSATEGTMAPLTGTITGGMASSTFTSTSANNGTACAMVDNQGTCTNITVLPTVVTIAPAGTPTAGDNDYTRINNAVQASFDGQTIKLLGTFNWTEPNAAASWAKGSNGIAGDLDDYSILAPANLNGVTITADNLGDATIQGPGDLAAVNLEGVFVFDSVGASINQGWTISNIRFVDFDLAIGMFAGASNAFFNTTITGNYIKIAQDLNATAAPADVNQNIGIHYAFGKNQTISGNTIEFNGDGVSAGANFSTQVGMQSNTSGGDVYDGLEITNNILRVLNAQSANPQVILGIWENAHGHSSGITVSGNSFTNLAGGNNPATNLQRGFRVTSHSSATTAVNYQNNTVMGANIGFQWLAGSNFSGNLPVSLKSNTIVGGGTGVVVQSQGSANLSLNRIVSNSVAGLNNVDGTATAENNWWGCNAGPGAGGCDSVTGTADFNPWIVLNVSASPNPIPPGGMSTVTADMTDNSAAMDTTGLGTVPQMPVAWSATQGTMSPPTGTITAGMASSTFTSTTSTPGTGCAMVDSQQTCTPIALLPTTVTITPAGTPTAADNDYTRINNAVQASFNGQTIKLLGTFNWTETNAAASWSKGSNDIAGDLDDYSILVPPNLNGVIFTADNLGDGTIQGPGDLPGLDLEGVFFFNSASGSKNQGWTISNIRFLDFDLTIGMFIDTGGASDAFSNTQIVNNYIRMARDVATATDTFQNIAIHYSFGVNELISGNAIDIQGDGLTVGSNFASDVAMQSNTSGGSVYDGLQITNNTIRVLNAQSGTPQIVLGIWENAHAHSSDITVSGNSFTNLAGGNNTATNLQRGFRVTSHSSATTAVNYQNNTVMGANIGFQWLAGSNFSGNLPVSLKSNSILGNGTGVLVQSQGSVNLSLNRIVGNNVTGLNNVDGTASAENNWWGCNAGPGGGGCDSVTGTADFNPWIVLNVSASPNPIPQGTMSTVTADMTDNSAAMDTTGLGTVPQMPIAWSATEGTMSPPTGTITAGMASSTFTSTSANSGSACGMVDNQNTCTTITVLPTVVTITPAATPTAADNDYTRINNAVQASFDGQTIKLLGTFNWTEPNAAASWAKGSNGIAGDLDDYSILVPANLNGVIFTADNLGDATIQGPGDLAAVNLEGVLVFDSVAASTNQNWTISKIRFVDFDLAIGMFAGASNAYLNTSITGNYIKIAQDLNATAAPADVNQNIGIHYAFGKNQTISGNTIEFDGSGVSDGSNFSSEVGMQSNTSGGDVYDGLEISNNTLRVLNAQSANPENLLGIWENGHAHTSNITVSGNSFTNLAAGNNRDTNLQRGFRVTSHSSAATTVNYQNNTVMGANIGFQWLAGQNFSGNLPVTLKSNTILGNRFGVMVQSQGAANLSLNRIVGQNLAGLLNTDGTVTAENNWWGCNAGPGAPGCDSVVFGPADFTPWIVLNVSASPNPIPQGTTSTVTADMTDNSAAMDTTGLGTVPQMPIAWSATEGMMSPPTGTITAGMASSTFTSTSANSGPACGMVDNQNTCTTITVLPTVVTITPAVTPTASDNDYTRINNAVQASFNGQTIKLLGTFNWTETNAAASWSRGSNNTAGDLDDYSILVPANLSNVIFTADNLGDATIQGPGDLGAIDLEGVFFFNSASGSKNQNWTISNIRFLDFDLTIGMFIDTGGASDAFSNTHIVNNYIRMARDVAPMTDTFQNIGIHYSFGVNQLITGNAIDIRGDGVGSSVSDVAMQSNTSGGNVYDGLQITNNTIRVLNAQSSNPQLVIGIWENGHAHSSDITVSGNSFTNLGGENNPGANLQRAFRVTSHSSATTAVNYQNNTVMGANIGFQWLAGSNFAGNLPVSLKSNTILGNGTGVLVQSQGMANLSLNRIVGNSIAGLNNVVGTVTAENNWWGCNEGPGTADCDAVTGTADFNPWLVLNVNASPNPIPAFGMSTVTADMTDNSNSLDTTGLGAIPLTPVAFSATEGTMAPPSGTITAGMANSIFTSTSIMSGTACATVDNEFTCTNITVIAPAPTPTPTPTATPTPTPTPTPAPTPTPPPIPTPTPSATPGATPTPTPAATPSPTATPTPTPAQTLNISTRLRVETGDRVLIGGFIVQGNGSKPVLVRGLGPSLAAFGITNVLLDPRLELRGPGGLIMGNDNWMDNPQRAQFEGTVFQPSDNREAVVVASVPAENYTVILSGVGATTGVGLIEVYDRDQAVEAELANISTRGFVQTGENVMIGGFILGGDTNTNVVVRGLGPSLANFGVSDFLADPTLELRSQNGTLLVANDDWTDDSASAAQLTLVGLAPQHPDEAAIFTSLPPGQFTAILAGKNGGVGVGLVEIYNLR